MKRPSFAFPLIFVLFFMTGIVMGFSYSPPETPEPRPTSPPPPHPVINTFQTAQQVNSSTKQLNVLIIGVEEVGSANTRLMSIWLILVPPGNNEITFLPIYPQLAINSNEEYAQTHDPVWVNAHSPESATIVRLLADENTWWDEIALVDAEGMRALLGLLGGEDLYSDISGNAMGLMGAPTPWAQPQAALEAQTALIKKVCEQSPSFAKLLNPGAFVLPPPSHFQITTNQVDLFAVLYDLSASITGFGCHFPMID